MSDWQTQKRERQTRLEAGGKFSQGKVVRADDTTALLEAVVYPSDRVCLESDNQKQADYIADCLVNVDPAKLHDLHVVQSGVTLSSGSAD